MSEEPDKKKLPPPKNKFVLFFKNIFTSRGFILIFCSLFIAIPLVTAVKVQDNVKYHHLEQTLQSTQNHNLHLEQELIGYKTMLELALKKNKDCIVIIRNIVEERNVTRKENMVKMSELFKLYLKKIRGMKIFYNSKIKELLDEIEKLKKDNNQIRI